MLLPFPEANNTPQIMLLLHMQIWRYFNKICDNPSYHTLTRLIIVFITSNILYSPASGLFSRLPGEQTFRSPACCCCVPREITIFRNTSASQGNFHRDFSRTVDITMRPNVHRLIERNDKCHVTSSRYLYEYVIDLRF